MSEYIEVVGVSGSGTPARTWPATSPATSRLDREADR